MSFDFNSALDRREKRRNEPPAPLVEKWLDGTAKDQPRVRDHAGHVFDRERFVADPEYRVKNHDAYVRMRHLEDEQAREAEYAAANERARQEKQARLDGRIREVAEQEIRAEESVELADEHARKVAERVEQLRPAFTPTVEKGK